MDNLKIIHEQTRNRFMIAFAGDEAELTYSVAHGKMYFNHTYTPFMLRGKGIAAQLVAAGLDFASVENLTPVPVCSYVVNYLQANKQ